MARNTVIIDDIDGSLDAQPFPFAVDGVAYTIDLADRNREKFAKAMAPFLNKATRIRPAAAVKAKNGVSASAVARAQRDSKRDYDIAELRQWAARSGIALPSRGRIPQAIVAQFCAGFAS